MSVIEIIEFTTLPGTTAAELGHALDQLDHELHTVGGFRSRALFRAAGTDNGWILDYRWDHLAQAQNSMSKVAATQAFNHVMALIDAPQTMKMSYGIPA